MTQSEDIASMVKKALDESIREHGQVNILIAGRTGVGKSTLILKLIPGGGTLAGGAISATTAAALTTTLGELYAATLAALFTESGGEAPDSEAVAREFKRRLGSV